MRIPQQPLSEEETRELASLLEQSGGKALAFGRGVFAAVATAPTPMEATEWLPLLLGEEMPDASALRRVFSLVLRDYNASADCLELGVPAVPASDDEPAVTEFCKGFVRIAERDPLWKKDTEAFALILPLAAIAGYAPEESIAKLEPDAASDMGGWLQKKREHLSDLVAELFSHMETARTEARKTQASRSEKVGRNDPCPCGSGRKYKKCCGTA